MGRRHDRDRFFGDIDAETQAGPVDVGKPVDDERGRFVGDVQQDVVGAALLHLAVNGPGHDVARGQRLERMIAVHELAPLERSSERRLRPGPPR